MNNIKLLLLFMILPILGFSADRLDSGKSLEVGQKLTSSNGQFEVTVQPEGGIVLIDKSTKRRLWSLNTFSEYTRKLIMQKNGDLVLRDNRNNAIWRSNTVGGKGSYLIVQDDGNLVIYAIPAPQAVWATGTNQEADQNE